MPLMQNLTNARFGRWLVTGIAPRRNTNRSVYWYCLCDCGTTKEIEASSLRRGLSTSCGCFQRETKTIHNNYKSPTYNSWDNMIGRCYRPSSPEFDNYGGRGLKVCQQWLTSFQTFLSDMGERPVGTTLDRKNVDGNYEPGNCEWSSNKAQQNNKRNSLRVPYAGTFLTLEEFSVKTGIPIQTLRNRRFRGVPLDKLHLTPKEAGVL